MNEQQLEDLKQFIDGRISQTEARFNETLDERLGGVEGRLGAIEIKLEELRKDMLDGFTGVGEAIDEINKHFDERLTKLENQAA